MSDKKVTDLEEIMTEAHRLFMELTAPSKSISTQRLAAQCVTVIDLCADLATTRGRLAEAGRRGDELQQALDEAGRENDALRQRLEQVGLSASVSAGERRYAAGEGALSRLLVDGGEGAYRWDDETEAADEGQPAPCSPSKDLLLALAGHLGDVAEVISAAIQVALTEGPRQARGRERQKQAEE